MSTVSPGLLRAPRTVIFGPGQRQVLGRQVAGIGKTALVCTDRRLAGSPELAIMIEDLSDHGVSVAVWSETEAELPSENIATCHAAMADRGIDVVIGIGGGSCLDMAKAVALLLAHGGPLDRYYGEYAVPGPVLPIVAVPTTAGTGSEATPVCVLTDARRELKTGISSPELIPTIAICDPELTVSCPTALTASAGADALTHLVESFTAIRRPATVLSEQRVFIGKNAISDHYARWGLQLIATALPAAVEDPSDLAARADTMLAANAGGFALGVAGTAAAHALQYPIGAITHTPHGVGVGVLLPYVMRFNVPERVGEFAEIGRLLGQSADSERELALKGIEAVDAILTKIGIPKTLADIGLTEDRLEYVAEQGLVSKRLAENNPRPLDVDAMRQIVTAAYRGDLTLPF
ncbi:iron-containing alcohol dehydrogenase [Microlunatus speluncae]|uniref:iron-containing alcohol dehydrogenase n=1 Tax=Microlunatus speluncae TaxID=2594267 RepID=UPI00126670E0|nr:iron-containing alcohol dehydrogenase [Microlunatus speluncae]